MTSNPKPASLWDQKPWWCQPWSIVVTGVAIVLGIGQFTHNLVALAGSGVLVSLWWFYFLIYVPRLFAAYQAQQLTPPSPVDAPPP